MTVLYSATRMTVINNELFLDGQLDCFLFFVVVVVVVVNHTGMMEKEMAIHSSILAWSVPRTEEPGGLQSIGSQGVGHN